MKSLNILNLTLWKTYFLAHTFPNPQAIKIYISFSILSPCKHEQLRLIAHSGLKISKSIANFRRKFDSWSNREQSRAEWKKKTWRLVDNPRQKPNTRCFSAMHNKLSFTTLSCHSRRPQLQSCHSQLDTLGDSKGDYSANICTKFNVSIKNYEVY